MRYYSNVQSWFWSLEENAFVNVHKCILLDNLIWSHKFNVKLYIEDFQIFIINPSYYLDSNYISSYTLWYRCPRILIIFSRSLILFSFLCILFLDFSTSVLLLSDI